MNRYIKLFESLTEWEWYKDSVMLKAFIHCLLCANWRPQQYRGMIIPRGAFVTTRRQFAEESGLTEQNVRTALRKLQVTQEITQESTQGLGLKFTVIYVKNFERYQGELTQESTQESTRDQPSNRSRKIEYIYKYINNNIGEAPEPFVCLLLKDGTEYPIYESHIEKWTGLYPAVDVRQELRSMSAWCESNPQKRKTKSGVLRFVNSWLSRAQQNAIKPQDKPRKGHFQGERTEDLDAELQQRVMDFLKGE